MPLRVTLALLLVVVAVLVWQGNGLIVQHAEGRARENAYTDLAVAGRDALLARLYQGLTPESGGETAMLARAARIEAALDHAQAVSRPGAERSAVAEIAAIAERLRELTDRLPREAIVETYASGVGRRLAERYISLSDELLASSRGELAGLSAARKGYRAILLPLFAGIVLVMLLLVVATARHGAVAARGEAAARLMPRIEAERDRADLLARELRHRVKNLFAVIGSIVTASARGSGSPREIAAHTRGRIEALALAHDLSSNGEGLGEFSALEALRAVAAPYAPAPARLEVGGDRARVPSDAATPLGLVINELATNAVKHGAWSVPDGTVRALVAERPGLVEIVWRESGSPARAPSGEGAGPEAGFGSAMIDMSVRQLGGTLTRREKEGGLEIVLTLPDGAAARSGRASAP